MTNRLPALCAAVSVAAILVAACATPPSDTAGAGTAVQAKAPPRSESALSPALADAAERAQAPGLPTADDKARMFKGTGIVVKGQQPGGGVPPGPVVQQAGGGVVLNFEGADLREVVKNILGDILNESYMIDATVGGQVTIRTSSGIPRDALPATL